MCVIAQNRKHPKHRCERKNLISKSTRADSLKRGKTIVLNRHKLIAGDLERGFNKTFIDLTKAKKKVSKGTDKRL